jgi:hypothetical protein
MFLAYIVCVLGQAKGKAGGSCGGRKQEKKEKKAMEKMESVPKVRAVYLTQACWEPSNENMHRTI